MGSDLFFFLSSIMVQQKACGRKPTHEAVCIRSKWKTEL